MLRGHHRTLRVLEKDEHDENPFTGSGWIDWWSKNSHGSSGKKWVDLRFTNLNTSMSALELRSHRPEVLAESLDALDAPQLVQGAVLFSNAAEYQER